MENADDIELAGVLFKCVLVLLAAPAVGIAANFAVHLIR